MDGCCCFYYVKPSLYTSTSLEKFSRPSNINTVAAARLPVTPSGRRVEQTLDINKEHLEYLLAIGFSVSTIAKDGLLGAKNHGNTISAFTTVVGMTMPRQRLSAIPDA